GDEVHTEHPSAASGEVQKIARIPKQHASSYRHDLEILRGRQKPGPGVPAYTRWINRTLAGQVPCSGVTVDPSLVGYAVSSSACSGSVVTSFGVSWMGVRRQRARTSRPR